VDGFGWLLSTFDDGLLSTCASIWLDGYCLPVTVDGWIVVPAIGIVVSVPVTVCTVVTLHTEIDTHFLNDLQQNS